MEVEPKKTAAKTGVGSGSGNAVPSESNTNDFGYGTHTADNENSGLHDIRELALSARSRRASTQQPIEDLSAASASFPMVTAAGSPIALPVQKTATPALGMPGIVKTAKADPATDATRIRARGTEAPEQFSPAVESDDSNTARVVVAKRNDFIRPATTEIVRREPVAQKSSKMIPFIGAGILAVAAIGFGVYTFTKEKAPAQVATAPVETAPAVAPAPVPAPAAVNAAAPAEPEVVVAPEVVIPTTASEAADKKKADEAKAKALAAQDGKDAKDAKGTDIAKAPEAAKAAPVETAAKKPGDTSATIDDLMKGAAGDGSFASVDNSDEKKLVGKAELSRADIKKGFSSVQGATGACYKTHKETGSVSVKVTVDPSGSVTKAVPSGSFAGTPTGDCVAAAAKGAKFPAWDGERPMTLSYSFLLGD